MMDRARSIQTFLHDAGWADADRRPLAGDLSARQYFRLVRPNGDTAILMDAPPLVDASVPAFLGMTEWLRDADLSAPAVLAKDRGRGLLLLEDFGDMKLSVLIEKDPTRRSEIYTLCIDLLIHIRNCEVPDLVRPDASELVDMTRLAEQHYPGLRVAGLSTFRARLETVLADLLTNDISTSLRDFHADNLMWLPERSGVRKLGLLDYQDAFLTHPVYDLVSLLTDARTDIDPQLRHQMIDLYARESGDDIVRLALAFAAFSAQRNLRILGIFTSAAAEFGKTAHLPKLPRVHGYLVEALGHPVFADVAAEALAAIPRPDPKMIESLA